MQTAPPAAHDPREIVSERVIAAPREKIYRAIAQPEHLARWWGPKGFRNTFEQFDFRPGGHWKFVMHGPDGTDYANHNVFLEIEPPSRVVLEHQSAPHFRAILALNEQDGKTHMHWRMIFATAQLRDQIAVYAVPANEQNFDRLEAELARMS